MQRSFVPVATSALLIGLLPVPAQAVEPVPTTTVTAAQPLARIGGGAGHTVFLAPDGRVAATGANGQGQLGDGTTTDRLVSVFVENLTDVVAVDAGGFHSLALDSSGRVWGWGDNSIGQVGDGTTIDRLVPVQVDPTNLDNVVAIAAGFVHSMALRSDGTVWAWGNNRQGQLGDGSQSAESHVPVQVDDTNLTGAVAIAAGEIHSLAIDANADAWAWGWNGFGQVGDGTINNIRFVPVQVDDTNLPDVVAVAGGGNAGEGHSLALDVNGAVWGWGANFSGQLGDGSSSTSLVPVQVDDTNLTGAVEIAAGGWHSLALDANGNVWSWGDNLQGQLGDGTTTRRTAPVPVLMTDMEQANDIGVGGFHSLAIQDFPNERWAPWAWGNGHRGQLGSARTSNFSEPIPVTRPFEP